MESRNLISEPKFFKECGQRTKSHGASHTMLKKANPKAVTSIHTVAVINEDLFLIFRIIWGHHITEQSKMNK